MIYRPGLTRHRLLLAGSAIAALSVAQSALAQTASGAQVSEVVVTAEKRSENIQVVPAAVSSISPELLADTHATALIDLGGYVPGLQINTAGTPGQTSISIRGIAPIGPGATVATYIDDSPVGSSSAYGGGVSFALDLLPYDLDRVEVLRGPQGTLYGASSMGGLLKYVLTTPSLTRFQAQAGADLFGMAHAGQPGGGVRATISGPLVEDKLGATASVAYEKTPGFIDNPILGTKNQNGYYQLSGRLGFLWQPTSNLKVKLNVLYQKVDAGGDGNVALDGATLQPIVGPWSDNNLRPQPFIKDILYNELSIDYSLPWADLISATSYSDTRTSQAQDESYIYGVALPLLGLPAGTSQSITSLHLKKVTQEFRLQSLPSDKLEWLAGVFVTNEDSANHQSPDVLVAGVPVPGVSPIFDAQLPSTYTEYAVFGDLTYHVTRQLDILGGVRYSENYQSSSEIATSALLGDVTSLDNKSHDGVATYSVGAKYRFTDKVMGYVRVASGYQPGGPDLIVPGSNAPPTFQPDTLTNYEVGVKSQFFDNRVLLDVDAFDIEWNHIQLLVNFQGTNSVANGGTARSRGIEANGAIRPLPGLSIEGSFAYVDARLTQDVIAIGALSGDRLPNIPSYSGSLRASYTHAVSGDWSANFGAGLRMENTRLSDLNHVMDSRALPGFGTLDLNASLSNGKYTVRLFAKNVTDKHAYESYNVLENGLTSAVTEIEASVLQPRVIGVAIDAKY